MVKGRVEFRKVKNEVWIGIGIPGWRMGMPAMSYEITFTSTEWRQDPKFPLEKPSDKIKRIGPFLYKWTGWVAGFPWDAIYVKRPVFYVHVRSNIPFDVVVNKRTIMKDKKSVSIPLELSMLL